MMHRFLIYAAVAFVGFVIGRTSTVVTQAAIPMAAGKVEATRAWSASERVEMCDRLCADIREVLAREPAPEPAYDARLPLVLPGLRDGGGTAAPDS